MSADQGPGDQIPRTRGMAVLADGGSAMMKNYVFECDVSA